MRAVSQGRNSRVKTSLRSCLATIKKAGKMFGVVKDYLRWRDSSRLTCYKCLGIDRASVWRAMDIEGNICLEVDDGDMTLWKAIADA